MNYLKLPIGESVDFYSAGKYVAKDNHAHPRRILKSAVLLMNISGKMPISQMGNEYLMEKGDFIILFPDVEHFGYAPVRDNQSHFWCHFSLPERYTTEENFEGTENHLIIPEFGSLSNPEPYYIIFNQMIDAVKKNYTNDVFRQNICNCYMNILLNRLADDCIAEQKAENQSSVMKKRKALLFKIDQWIKLHFDEQITAADVAGVFHYNPDYLSQIFKAEWGMGLCEYINSVRIKEAKNLLLNSDAKIYQIAYQVGFNDNKYFMKLFKKFENVTPTQYRESYFRTSINVK